MIETKAATKSVGDVYRYIYHKKTSSRQMVVNELGISMPTVKQSMNQLMDIGLICNTGEFQSTGGRRATVYQIVDSARCSFGIDITYTYISIVLVDLNLRVLDSVKMFRVYEDCAPYYESIGRALQALIEKNGIERQMLLGVGVSLPSIIEEETDRVSYTEVVELPKDFCGKLAKYIPFPVHLCNDANSAGWAEVWTRGRQEPMVYLSLSNSVGGAIFMNGQMYKGENWRGAEFGHMKLVPNGRLCYCGGYGCMDTYCSARILSDFTGGNLDEFFRQMRNGNEGFQRVFRQYLEKLAAGVNNLRMCFDCEVVLGGNVGMYLEDYLYDLKRLLSNMTPFEESADYVTICSLRKEPSAIGAALYFVDKFIQCI